MIARDSLILELEESITHGGSDKRVETLRRVTDLFLSNAPAFSEDQVGVFDDVIGRLAAEIETRAKVELAERLAPVDNAPSEVVKKLAHDDEISVAGPILKHSTRLNEADIIEIAQTKGQDHLMAISNRAEIGEKVTDVLVERGSQDVIRNVAGNQGARFSGIGFGRMVERSKSDAVLQERVGLRMDIPPQHFRTLLTQAEETVKKKLAVHAQSSNSAEIQKILSEIVGKIGSEAGAAPRNYDAAKKIVLSLHSVGKLGESEVQTFAKARKFEETVCAMSALSGVSIDVVERLMTGDRPDPVLIICKATGMSWPTVKAVILARPSVKGTTNQGLEESFDNYERLSVGTAQRVMRFWQVRESALKAGG